MYLKNFSAIFIGSRPPGIPWYFGKVHVCVVGTRPAAKRIRISCRPSLTWCEVSPPLICSFCSTAGIPTGSRRVHGGVRNERDVISQHEVLGLIKIFCPIVPLFGFILSEPNNTCQPFIRRTQPFVLPPNLFISPASCWSRGASSSRPRIKYLCIIDLKNYTTNACSIRKIHQIPRRHNKQQPRPILKMHSCGPKNFNIIILERVSDTDEDAEANESRSHF